MKEERLPKKKLVYQHFTLTKQSQQERNLGISLYQILLQIITYTIILFELLL